LCAKAVDLQNGWVAGNYRETWNASEHSCSVYFYRLQAGIFIDTKKLILVKIESK
jgi:hypothetical protein